MNAALNAAPELHLRRQSGKSVSDRLRGGHWIRYEADRRAVVWVGVMLAAHATVFFLAPAWVAALFVIPLTVGSMFVAAINHHHQHFNVFQSAWMNRVFDLALALQTGVSPYAWVLHHNLGHHVNYLHQRPHAEPDESKWTRRDGTQMGRIEYTIDLLLHHQLDILRVGLRYPKYLRAFLWMKLPLWSLIGLAFYLDPANAFLVILLPGFLTLAHTVWVTYEHHAGFHSTSHDDASMNNVNPLFNYVTCNLGYHTAHHKRPGVHWSLLPQIHEEIKHRIPPEQIQTAFW
jgi:fatty acid desaturase